MNVENFPFKDSNNIIISKANIKFSNKIPRKNADFFKNKIIHTCYIKSPSSFYIKEDGVDIRFDYFQSYMNEYYNLNYNNLNIPEKCLYLSLNCVFFCHQENKWKRGVIINIDKEKNYVQVKHVDEPFESKLNKFKTFFLLTKFWDFPQKISNCRLSNIGPLNLKYWSKESVTFFKGEVQSNVSFSIEIKNDINDTFYVILNDLELMQNIEDVMVQFGYALNSSTMVSYFPIENQ